MDEDRLLHSINGSSPRDLMHYDAFGPVPD